MALKATQLLREVTRKVCVGQYQKALWKARDAYDRALRGRQPNLTRKAERVLETLFLLTASGSATEVLGLSRTRGEPCQCCGAKMKADGRRVHRNCLLASARQFERQSGRGVASLFEGVLVRPIQMTLTFETADGT